MIYIPTELTQSAELGGIILILSAFISIVFRQSATVSILVAKTLVSIALRILNAGNKWSKEHDDAIKVIASDWHILKTKLTGGKIGQG